MDVQLECNWPLAAGHTSRSRGPGLGLVMRRLDVVVAAILFILFGMAFSVVYYWFWEGVRRMIEKLFSKRGDG
jgi:hypothetical protein